jgi:single-strand DNA-binding protein
MAGVNKVILVGNLGADPEIRYLDTGVAVANFRIATTENYKNKQGEKVSQTEWHNIVLWRGLAEVAEKWLNKGSSVYIEGKIRTRKWQDKEGNTRYNTEILADNMTMLGSKKESSNILPEEQINPNNQSINESNDVNDQAPKNESADDLPF